MDVGCFQTHDYSKKPLVSALAVTSATEFCNMLEFQAFLKNYLSKYFVPFKRNVLYITVIYSCSILIIHSRLD